MTSENFFDSTEVNKETPFLEFSYKSKKFSVKRQPMYDSEGQPTDGTKLLIFDTKGTQHGEILGKFQIRDDGREDFFCEWFENTFTGSSGDHTEGHISELIKETMAQCIVQRKINNWVSSTTILQGGIITYEALTHDERLNYQKELQPTPYMSGEPRYKYTFSLKA